MDFPQLNFDSEPFIHSSHSPCPRPCPPRSTAFTSTLSCPRCQPWTWSRVQPPRPRQRWSCLLMTQGPRWWTLHNEGSQPTWMRTGKRALPHRHALTLTLHWNLQRTKRAQQRRHPWWVAVPAHTKHVKICFSHPSVGLSHPKIGPRTDSGNVNPPRCWDEASHTNMVNVTMTK